MRICLFQPDIAQNVGAIMRLCACFDTPLDIIAPCGFPVSDKSLKRTAMDYADHVEVRLHSSWRAFLETGPANARRVLLTTKSADRYDRFAFRSSDTLILGRESAGVPADVHDQCDARLRIPLCDRARSLNVAIAAGIALAEAMRQTCAFDVLR